MRYQPAVLAEEVYLHPRSALAATAPEYVVYSTLLATDKRRYLVGVTPLEPHWLGTSGTPLCTGEEGGGGGGEQGQGGQLVLFLHTQTSAPCWCCLFHACGVIPCCLCNACSWRHHARPVYALCFDRPPPPTCTPPRPTPRHR